MTQIIKSNTGVMHSLINFGTYDGQRCCVDYFVSNYDIRSDFKEGYTDYLAEEYWEHFDRAKYMDRLRELANDFIQKEIVPSVLDLDIGVLGIKGVDTWSPREYNFATDELILEIEVEDNFQETAIALINNLDEDELKSYKRYLRDYCTSYDGFCSFVSNKIPDIIDEIQKDINATELECFIDWHIEYHCNEDWDRPWMNYLHENIYRSDFLPDDFQPYSRKMVEAYTPLVAALATTPQAEYRTIEESISQILDEHPPEDFDIDELRLSKKEEKLMRDFLVRELRKFCFPAGSQVIPGLEEAVNK